MPASIRCRHRDGLQFRGPSGSHQAQLRAIVAFPSVPALPGRGTDPVLFDTSTGQLRSTAPGTTARLYVCGITPYDSTHLGHAATYTAFDLLQRVWRDAGHDVDYVQNITDVDDPLLEGRRQIGEDWRVLADREIARFVDDMTELRILAPKRWVGVAESIPDVVRAIERLIQRGAVYAVDGDLYFDVTSDPRFGAVGELLRTDAGAGR